MEKEISRKKNELQFLQNSILNIEDVGKERVLREELEVLMLREELKWPKKLEIKELSWGTGTQGTSRPLQGKEELGIKSCKSKPWRGIFLRIL